MFGGDQIAAAIREKRVLQFRYKIQMRRVEPHALGYDSDGDLTLSAWQTSGIRPGWRDFHVAKLRELSTTGEHFAHARPGYNRNDTTLSRVIAHL